MAVMIAANALDSLLLWNFFPMHMRGVAPTFTDTMHGLLAINPFVLATIGLAVVAFTDWFRVYSIATILMVVFLAMFAFRYAPQFIHGADGNLSTPWLGMTERIGQYSHQVWHAILAFVLLRDSAMPVRSPGYT